MTKITILFCFFVSLALAQNPTVTAISVTNNLYSGQPNLSHSQVQFQFTSTNWTSGPNPQLRIRVTPGTLSSCTGQLNPQPAGEFVFSYVAVPNDGPNFTSTNVGGLTPGQAWTICPELANGQGSMTWFPSAIPLHVTTPAAPSIHPAPPNPPVTFNTSYPATAGYTVINETSCAQTYSDFYNAIAARASHGTVINGALGCTYNSQWSQYSYPLDPDVKTLALSSNPSLVSTSNKTITFGSTVNEGQQIVFGDTGYSRIPGSNGQRDNGPIISGMPEWIHCFTPTSVGSACPGGVAQIYLSASYQNGGVLANLTDTGSGTLAYVTLPRSPNWVVLQAPGVATNTFVPEHSRVQGPVTTDGVTQDQYPGQPTQWSPQMLQFQTPYSLITNNQGYMSIGGSDVGTNPMLTHIRFVGVEFTHGPDGYETTSIDPDAWNTWITTYQESDDVIFDRCWFHNAGKYERNYTDFSWNGRNVAFVDSYFDGLLYFHPGMSGFGVPCNSYSPGCSSPALTTTANSISLPPGLVGFGSGSGQTTSTANISWTGSPSSSSQQRAYLYFGMTGNILNLVFPPGVTPSVSGINNYHVVNLQGPTVNGPSGSGSNNSLWYVDPIVSSSSSCNSTTSLLANINTSATPVLASGYPGTYDTRFVSDLGQYVCGVRFYKLPGDTATSRTMTLITPSWSVLASTTTSGEPASGWVTGMFSSPYRTTAGTQYAVTYSTTVGPSQALNYWRNADLYNAGMHISGAYVGSNGATDSTDSFPLSAPEIDGHQAPYVGPVAYIDISASGTLVGAGVYNAAAPHSLNSSAEGSQSWIAGIGPGPYIFQDNYVEGAGNLLHFDNSGALWDPYRTDYTVNRNYWRFPSFACLTYGNTDGNWYLHRHFLEWKDGLRIQIKGNIFNGGCSDATPTQESIEISPKDGQTTSDVLFRSNSIFHAPGGLLGPSEQENTAGNPAFQPQAPARFEFSNNLLWDINGLRHCNNCGEGKNLGWATSAIGAEDSVIKHNTILLNTSQDSQQPLFMYLPDRPFEGAQITDNFINTVPTGSGAYLFGWYDPSGGNTNWNLTCSGKGNGEPQANCHLLPNYVFAGNVISSTSASAAQISSAFPNHMSSNYVQTTDPTQLGFFTANGWNFTAGGMNTTPNLKLRSQYCSGCAKDATDRTDVGADLTQLEADQGMVTLSGVPETTLTTTSATVVFVAPDSQGCSVDYSDSDPTVTSLPTSNTADAGRVADPGGSTRVRNVTLSNLRTKQNYWYRVNCAVQQPMGQFRTN